jgi:hypothetical protein
VEIPHFQYALGMANPRKRPVPPNPDPSPASDWTKWSTELPSATIADLKIRAAQERRPMRETLRDAILAYCATPLRGAR